MERKKDKDSRKGTELSSGSNSYPKGGIQTEVCFLLEGGRRDTLVIILFLSFTPKFELNILLTHSHNLQLFASSFAVELIRTALQRPWIFLADLDSEYSALQPLKSAGVDIEKRGSTG